MIRGCPCTVPHDYYEGFRLYDVYSIELILHCCFPYFSRSPNNQQIHKDL